MSLKYCPACKVTKDTDQFYKLKNDKRYGYCTICVKHRSDSKKEYRKQYYLDNIVKVKEKEKIYGYNKRRTNPEVFFLRTTKHRAKKYNLPFDLELSDIIIPEKCPVLGLVLVVSEKRSTVNSPSIDKVIPELGYVKGNINIISWRANTIKNNASLEDIQNIISFLENVEIDSITQTIVRPIHHYTELIYNSKYRANKLNIEHTIKTDDIIIPDKCPMLGIDLIRGSGKSNFLESSPTLDRINPTLGYTPENVIVVSYKANRIKNNATLEELKLIENYMRLCLPKVLAV